MSRDDGDRFEDVRRAGGALGGVGGMFGGQSLGALTESDERHTPEGVVYRMQCEDCGRPTNVTISYDDLTIVGLNGPNKPLLKPKGWYLDEELRMLRPVIQCGCGSRSGLGLGFTPTEAQRLVSQGLQAGTADERQVQGIAAGVMARAGGR